MKPTIVDIAREAGVSIATVSKAIHNTGRMSEETRKKNFNHHAGYELSTKHDGIGTKRKVDLHGWSFDPRSF